MLLVGVAALAVAPAVAAAEPDPPSLSSVPRAPRKPPPPAEARPPTAPAGLSARFEEPGFGFRVDLPGDWVGQGSGDHTVVFAGPAGTTDGLLTLRIQNHRASTASPMSSAAAMMQRYIDQMKERAEDPVVRTVDPLVSATNVLRGVEADLGFRLGADRMRQWVIVRPRTDLPVVHLLVFTAPEPVFSQRLKLIQSIARSWTMVPVEPSP